MTRYRTLKGKTMKHIYHIWCRYANIAPDDFDCNNGDPLVGNPALATPAIIRDSPVLIGIKNVVKRISNRRLDSLSVKELDLIANICTIVIREILYVRQQSSEASMKKTYTLLSHPNNVKELFVDHGYEYSQVIDNHFELIQLYTNYLVFSAAYYRAIVKDEAQATS